MRKIFLLAGMVAILFIVAPPDVGAEVYDLDALTGGTDDQNTDGSAVETADDGADDQADQDAGADTGDDAAVDTNTDTPTNANISTGEEGEETDETAVTMAECIIFQRLEIYDRRCDELTRGLDCPNYAECLQTCEQDKKICFVVVAKKTDQPYKVCSNYYNTCTDRCSALNPQCSKKYPPRNMEGTVKELNLTNSTGDVRVTYLDNPTPAGMEEVTDNRAIQVGATIFTGEKGSTTVVLPSGITEVIGPNSYFRIADYYTGDNVDETYTILKNGSVRTKIDKQGDKTVEYVVITPLWKVEAKGTEFELTVEANGTTQLTTDSGEVQLRDHEDQLVAAVPAGESITTDGSGSISANSEGVFFPSKWAYYKDAYGTIALVVGVVGGILLVVIILLLWHSRRKIQRKKRRI